MRRRNRLELFSQRLTLFEVYMFTMDEMLSKKNQRLAFAHLASKRDGCGIDGMHVSELEEYWRLNESQISKKLRN